MTEKLIINIESKKCEFNLNLYDVSVVNKSGNQIIYDLSTFNKEGYLARLIANLNENNLVYYLLFSTDTHSDIPKNSPINLINNILNLSSAHITLASAPIKKTWFGEKGGKEAHCLMIKNGDFHNIQNIIEYIAQFWYPECYIILDKESEKDNVFSQCLESYKQNQLKKAKILAFASETIYLSFGCCAPEDSFEIFTKRFNAELIKNKILELIDKEKFEIIVR